LCNNPAHAARDDAIRAYRDASKEDPTTAKSVVEALEGNAGR
jgi:hypothetical protein